MLTCTPVSRAYGRTLLGAAAAAVLAACSDVPGRVTAPGPDAAQPAANRGAASNVAMCRIAVRSQSGAYLTRTAEVRMPRRLAEAGAQTTSFAYRGWKEGESDPVRLALCDIPATPEAQEWFAQLLSGKRNASVFNGANGRNADRPVKEAAGARTTQTMATYDSYSEPCRPYEEQVLNSDGSTANIDYGCGGGGGGWETGEEWDGPAPTEPEYVEEAVEVTKDPTAPKYEEVDYAAPDAALGPEDVALDGEQASALAAGVPITCSGQTDNPHRSGTPGFTHNANVHGRTLCNIPVRMTISVMLQRQRCVWYFCWWSSVGSPGVGGPVQATRLQRTSHALCQTGWWRGYSQHTVTPPLGYWPPYGSFSSSRTAYISQC
jgi:hypothetical protein